MRLIWGANADAHEVDTSSLLQKVSQIKSFTARARHSHACAHALGQLQSHSSYCSWMSCVQCAAHTCAKLSEVVHSRRANVDQPSARKASSLALSYTAIHSLLQLGRCPEVVRPCRARRPAVGSCTHVVGCVGRLQGDGCRHKVALRFLVLGSLHT